MLYSDSATFSPISYRMPGNIEYGIWIKFSTYHNVTSHGSIYPELTDFPPYGITPLDAYHALSPGYDAFVVANGDFPEMYDVTPIVILNADGSVPAKPAPVAHDDLVQIKGIWDGSLTVDQLVSNDNGGVLDFVQSVAVHSDIVQTVPAGQTGQSIALNPGVPINTIGSLAFGYDFTDAFGDHSNVATVTVEWFNGQSDRNHLNGTDAADTIDFSASHLAVGVYGLGGDDLIRGSQANDMLYGGDGNDRIGGRNGDDLIDGGKGNDLLFGEGGNDTISGGDGNDVLKGGDGEDVLRGGAGNDQAFGDNGNDMIGGKAGDDTLHGGAGNDAIWGDDGNDVLFGDAGNDSLNGGSGNDVLTGGLGIDRMRGEAGDDTFVFVRGEANGDTILDFEGAGIPGGDKIEFRGYGDGAAVHQVSADTWQIDAAGISETFKIAGVTALSNADFYFA